MYKILTRFLPNLGHQLRNVLSVQEATPQVVTREALLDTGDGINGALVHAFAHGSRSAFRRIYDRYAPAIYRVSCRYFQSEPLAEELVSEVFSAFWLKRAKFTEPEEVKLFLFASARSVAMKYLGKWRNEPLTVTNAFHIGTRPSELRNKRVYH